jgi:uncharacterized protein (TIGR03435 family)
MLLLLQHALLVALMQDAAAAHRTFEVVSVKPASPNRPGGRIVVGMTGREGGPGTGDPTRVRYQVISLRFVLFEAYGNPNELRINGPGFLDDDWFQIDATLPPGATEPQFHQMMQSLLADRFHLAFHRESKDVPAYNLVVAKGGVKMKPAPPLPAGQEPARNRVQMGSDRALLTMQQTTMERLANLLAGQLGGPVTDATELPGKYDFTLNFSKAGAAPVGAADAEPLPDLFTALAQLGLKLEPRKGSIEIFVIDHIDRTPTGN